MSKRTKKDKRPVAKIDFKPYGAAIKAGRTKQKESRNKAADALFISPRYLANIENKGQHPSVCCHASECGGFSFPAAAGAGAEKECGAGINPFSAFYPGLLSEHQI